MKVDCDGVIYSSYSMSQPGPFIRSQVSHQVFFPYVCLGIGINANNFQSGDLLQ